jgi:ferrochelatase
MAQHLRASIATLPEEPDHYVLTFHGIPRRYIETGDPYRRQCEHTAALLADAMHWADSEWRVGFQSRVGPEQWLRLGHHCRQPALS